jgi:hypothetical protein
MVSLFDLLPFYVGAAILGIAWTMCPFEGTVLRWPVVIAAGFAGWFLTRILFQAIGKLFDLNYQKKLRSLTVTEITRQIGDLKTPQWNLALRELKVRGENLAEPRLRLIELLGDESAPCRLFSSRALYEVFPQDIEKMGGYSPYDPAEKCKEKASKLKNTGGPATTSTVTNERTWGQPMYGHSKTCRIIKSFFNSGQHLSHVREEVVTRLASRPILSDSQWKEEFYPTAEIPESFITWFRQSISKCWGFDLSQAIPTDRLVEDLGLGTATWNDTYLDIVEDLMDAYEVSMPESRGLLDKSITTLDDMFHLFWKHASRAPHQKIVEHVCAKSVIPPEPE